CLHPKIPFEKDFTGNHSAFFKQARNFVRSGVTAVFGESKRNMGLSRHLCEKFLSILFAHNAHIKIVTIWCCESSDSDNSVARTSLLFYLTISRIRTKMIEPRGQ